ncbi:MAG TPA: efflux RND transporter periplasmic adaptor subunit [Gemmataceae bacterium]|nr:efflux RND transporter periplasmic adaptor subunit [Gemmataceae bacterium]
MNSPPPTVASHLRAALGPGAGGPADADLLARFAAARDEGAFELLVWRHAEMVLRACRGVLRDHHAAEDAAQAAFLALARRATAVGRRGTVAGWLYRVARRVAWRAARRRRLVLPAVDPDRVPGPAPAADPHLAGALLDELDRLPDKYRAPILLCYFDGLSHADAARRLGWPIGTVAGRLARARERLKRRLTHRGAGLPAAVFGGAAAPAGFAAATARAAVAFAVRGGRPAEISPAVLQLASAEIRSMVATKVQWGAGVLAVAGGLTVGAWSAAQGPGDGQPAGRAPAAAQLPGPAGRAGQAPPANDLENFRAVPPAARLRIVERRLGDKAEFPAAARGDLTPAVVERGSLDAATQADVVCAVRARGRDDTATTLRWVVDDGTMVKKGDKLIELDDSALRDLARAAKVRLVGAEAGVAGAAEELRAARRAGDIEVKLAEIEVALAAADLKDPSLKQSREVTELKVERAKLMLERTREQVRARVTRAEVEQRARAAAVELEMDRYRQMEAELTKCVLHAPFDGVAVYYVPPGSGRFGGGRVVIAPGEPVREGQKLLRVSALDRMVVVARVHEARISTVRNGHAAEVLVDAFPGKVIRGKVTNVSPVASQTDWMASDVKVYPVTVALDDAPPGLKPGMTAEVRIVTGDSKAALLVPVTAVVGSGRDRFCFVKSGDELVERRVVPGATDGRRVEIKEGLKEGEEVLADPLAVLGPPRGIGPKRPQD